MSPIAHSGWFFFFQAEDGIRYLTVTGVQTCALPISGASRQILGDRFQIGEGFEAEEKAHPRRSEEHTSELQSQSNLVCRLLLEKKKTYLKQGTEQILRLRMYIEYARYAADFCVSQPY